MTLKCYIIPHSELSLQLQDSFDFCMYMLVNEKKKEKKTFLGPSPGDLVISLGLSFCLTFKIMPNHPRNLLVIFFLSCFCKRS